MKLTVIGCSGSMAGPDAAASSYLLSATDAGGKEWQVVLDLGSGAFGPLQKVVNPCQIDAVAISHLHPDHFVDLCGMYVYLRYHPDCGTASGRGSWRIPVMGPAGTQERVAATFGLEPGEQIDCLQFADWTSEPRQVGPFEFSVFPVEHPVPAFALRISGPSSLAPGQRVTLAYSGDSDECAGLLAAAQSADLFLCEAPFLEGQDELRGVHLTGSRAGKLATQAGVRRLVLTHLQPWTDPAASLTEAKTNYAGPIDLAKPFQEFVL